MSQTSNEETQTLCCKGGKPSRILKINPLNDCLDTGFIRIVRCLTTLDPTKILKVRKQQQKSMWKGTKQDQQETYTEDGTVRIAVKQDRGPVGGN